MNALLSIKPEHVRSIVRGNKRYEFRRTIFKENIERVFIYSTSPVKMIVGAFWIGKIVEDSPEHLWDQFHQFAGLNAEEFFGYFKGAEKGFAIEIAQVKEFKTPINPKNLNPRFTPPQSFYYIDFGILPLAENLL